MQGLEVDAGAEDPSAAVAGVGHRSAAHHADVHGGIEEGEVDGRLHVVDLAAVLGVEAVVPAHGQVGHAVTAFQQYRGGPQDSGPAELRQQPQRPCGRLEHRRQQVPAGGRGAQHPAQEDALVDVPAGPVGR